MALSSQWANFVADKASSSASKDYLVDETGMVWHTYVPPPDYKPLFDYAEINRQFYASIGESDSQIDPNTPPDELMGTVKKMLNTALAKRMDSITVKDDLDPNDPLNEVLKW